MKPYGIIPAMITPLNEHQEINETTLRLMVNRFIAAGVHGLFCLGTNGEFFTLTAEEKVKVCEIVVDEADGRIPVFAGSGGISTKEVVELSERMQQTGVSALSVITPYFNPLNQNELFEHYKTLAESVSIPILLYNIPARTGNNLDPKTVLRLSAIPNIIGIKDSSGNFDLILQYIEQSNAEFAVLAGTDSLILPTLMAGGAGAIAATANIFPELVVSIYDYWKQGNMDKAAVAQKQLRPIRSVMQKGTLPSIFKEALNLLGFEAGSPKLPVQPLAEPLLSELIQILKQYELEGVYHN